MANSKKSKRSGGSFDWHPNTFEDAKHHVDMARNQTPPIGPTLAMVMPQAIQTLGPLTPVGGLTCPSPATDPDGVYRVGLDAQGHPEIQRRDPQGAWIAVP